MDSPDMLDVASRLSYLEGKVKAQEDSRERERDERHHEAMRRNSFWTGAVMGAVLMGTLWFAVSMVFAS